MAMQTSDVAEALTLNAFTNGSDDFVDWSTSANGAGGATYVNGATYPFTVSTTLYAQWAPTYAVTFEANGGTGTMAPETSDTAQALTLNTFANGSEEFVDWNTSANGSGTSYANGASYPFSSSTTLYAQWAPTYTVTFNANGGTGTMSPQTSDAAEALALNAFSNGNLTFVDWNTSANGSGTNYANGASYPFTLSTTLYAQWAQYSAPVIDQEPTNQSVEQGDTARFIADGAGTPTPTIQWQVSTNGGASWSTIPGATSDSYSVVAETTGYEYEAVFTNAVSSVTSSAAQLITLDYSSNWAGYVLTNGTFSAVSGSWTVPSVSCSSSSDLYAAEWVGIDGDLPGDTYVIQDGTSTDCTGTTPSYSAWYEFFGDSGVDDGFEVPLSTIAYPVAPGDSMSGSVSYSEGVWTFTLRNTTDGWTFSTTASNPSPPSPVPAQSSAEWIVEAPEICNAQGGDCTEGSLADFGTLTFTNASAVADGTTTSLITASGIALAMVNAEETVTLMSPGPLSDLGSSFTVTWQSS
jgi:Peptidase A4 family/Listeria-Bacteroides repeat domain (List_Bact_rpt)